MSYLVYEGPSMLDGQPIVCLATGIDQPSRNGKTGPMVQTYILRQDVPPLEAVKTGADKSICGDCKLRGNNGKDRVCYVTLFRDPTNVYSSARKPLPKTALNNRGVRLGAYGDPAALPTSVIRRLVKKSAVHTGYTHQWLTCDQDLKNYVMASCDSPEDRESAKSLGWQTFRVKHPEEQMLPGETLCPASEEAGKQMNCLACGKCRGVGSVDVVINVHGIGKRNFK